MENTDNALSQENSTRICPPPNGTQKESGSPFLIIKCSVYSDNDTYRCNRCSWKCFKNP